MTVLFVVALAAACSDDGGNPPPIDVASQPPADADNTPDAEPGPVSVTSCAGLTPAATIATAGFAFSPADVTINAGEVVRFMPAGPHNMTSGAPGAPDGTFATNTSQEACLTFSVAGSFPFFCSVHPTMLGSVTVN
jgi:plastocyanin